MNAVVDAVIERMFIILFQGLPCDIGCVPEEFRENDPCVPYITEDCQSCWLNYVRTQALLDLGVIERVETTMPDNPVVKRDIVEYRGTWEHD